MPDTSGNEVFSWVTSSTPLHYLLIALQFGLIRMFIFSPPVVFLGIGYDNLTLFLERYRFISHSNGRSLSFNFQYACGDDFVAYFNSHHPCFLLLHSLSGAEFSVSRPHQMPASRVMLFKDRRTCACKAQAFCSQQWRKSLHLYHSSFYFFVIVTT